MVLAGLIFLYFRMPWRQTGRDEDPPPPVPVVTATVQPRDQAVILTGLGTVTALKTATISSQVTGLLENVAFKEGQFVKQGDVLAQIDPRIYQAQLDQAQAQLSRDEANLSTRRRRNPRRRHRPCRQGS